MSMSESEVRGKKMKFEIEQVMLEKIVNRLGLQETVINYLTTREPLSQLMAEINQGIKPVEAPQEQDKV
jgi:hypothetical protein